MDRTQYERIANEYLDMVYKVALNYMGKTMDADDMVQQTEMSGPEHGESEDPVFAVQESSVLYEEVKKLPTKCGSR